MRTFNICFLILFVVACHTAEKKGENKILNPAAEGFNEEGSDSLAIVIADSVMVAMGGRENWDNLRFLKWNFFGARDLVWDKYTGRVRIDHPGDSIIYLTNVHTGKGKVQKNGKEITNPDSLQNYLARAKSIWINDSYWLVMPFKLKDSGVTLKYVGEGTTQKGEKADVLSLTFTEVGDTPQNKYEVYITKDDTLVKQWSYYRDASQDSASAIWPWDNYKKYSNLLLSANRSDDKGPKDVVVYDSLPDSVFESFAKPEL